MKLLILIFSFSFCLQAQVKRTINNELRMDWPEELVHMDFPDGSGSDFKSVTLSSADYGREGVKYDKWTRPVQLEKVIADGRQIDRVWFKATLRGVKGVDSKGKSFMVKPPVKAEVTFNKSLAPVAITMKKSEDHYLINNGVYEFRLRHYENFSSPAELGEIKHFIAGMRPIGSKVWEGKAFFEGTSKVHSVRTEILNQGAVFIDVKLTYDFGDKGNGETDSVKLKLGKQSHTYKPNQIPREKLPKKNLHYEVMMRFTANDSWIEVAERAKLPRDNSNGFGLQQYYLLFGKADKAPYDVIDLPKDKFEPIDTVSWVRWFLYDQFGGNSHQLTVEARPRPDQKGRPFALLRPKWNQGGGGAQDFVLTSGGARHLTVDEKIKRVSSKASSIIKEAKKGKTPPLLPVAEEAYKFYRDKNISKEDKVGAVNKYASKLSVKFPGDKKYSPENPAFGIVAAFASKWTNISTIAAYVRENQRGVRVPVTAGPSAENWYMTRSYAILCGPRKNFTNLNSIVRRHTDWTLVAQINKYILNWKRDPSVAGANIITSKERLAAIRKEVKAGTNIKVKESAEKLKTMLADYEKAKKLALSWRDTEKKAKDLYVKSKKLKNSNPDEAKILEAQAKDLKYKAAKIRSSADIKSAEKKYKSLEKKLKNGDNAVLALLLGKDVSSGKLPTSNTYRGTRYQDDANNPTNYGNRRMVNDGFPKADLLSLNKPFGGADQAAIGYIYTDLDSWPGWHNEWGPGNPNFHTDKYIASVYAAAAMQDHPHAKEWMEFGLANFRNDLKKVFLAPDGVGYECPGYSGYALSLQLEVGGAIYNSGMGNPFVENPLVKKSAVWHRKLITPFDKRIAKRHAAPLGDTHRWDSGLGGGFGILAQYYKKEDPAFASELMGTYKFLKESGAKIKGHGLSDVFLIDNSIKPANVESMDWSSDFFYGFGAIMRNNFGTERESFLTFKAGPTHGHYHNDELSWHFYSGGTPISLDYNCSYHPRGDHAALHNTSTFGRPGKVKHNGRSSNDMVEALEQPFGTAKVGAFVSTVEADLIVAERVSSGLSLSPVDPHDAEFQRKYPYRKTDKLIHRRSLVFVKHKKDSPLQDYIVVREDFHNTNERQQINLHLLGRSVEGKGSHFHIIGQHDKNIDIFFASGKDLKVEKRHWEYADEWTVPPQEYLIKEGEELNSYNRRMRELAAKHGQDTLPLKDWKMSYTNREGVPANTKKWHELINKTKGQALAPPPNWNSTWTYGETQQWMRIETAPGTSLLYVIYPHIPGQRPKFSGNENSLTVEFKGSKETIFLDGGASLIKNGRTVKLLEKGSLKPLGELSSEAAGVIRIKK